MKVAITGATGFIGGSLLSTFNPENCVVIGRSKPDLVASSHFLCANIDAYSDYSSILDNVDAVVHCAARVHVLKDSVNDPLLAFRDVNTAGTLNLAKHAAESGVKRFIFISTIKVNGESTRPEQSYTCFDQRRPRDAYGQSKAEAEEQLLKLSEKTGMAVVIIRPPLVYGPGVKANFFSLMDLVSKGLPLPFGLVNNNKRSMVSVNNLVHLIKTCIDHPKAANQVFLVSDDCDLSTAELIRCMARGLGKPARLLSVPIWSYRLLGRLLGKQEIIDRLMGSLRVDISYTKEILEWQPPQSVEEAFSEAGQAFLSDKQKRS